MRLGEAKTPAGMRLYAIGDVHGRNDLLGEVHQKIAADLLRRPPDDYRIIHCGDYVDRGPDSAGVIGRLVALTETEPRIVCLRGNHEDLLLAFLVDPARYASVWLENGGAETLASYGVGIMAGRREREFLALGERFAEALPEAHAAFLGTLALSATFGDFFFCHAGVRPGVPLDKQDPADLTWIRDDFLWDGRDHGVVVVHGHTPVTEPEVRRNRINIDTGAVFTGRLTCLVLEGTEHRFL